MATEYGQHPGVNIRVHEGSPCEAARIPEIHSFITGIHEDLTELGDLICSLDNRLSCVSTASSPTADSQASNRLTESPLGHELNSINMRIKGLMNQVRDIRNRLCV